MKASRSPRRRKLLSPVTDRIEAPLDLEAHVPYRVAILSNLLQLDRDPLVRAMTRLGLRELRVLLNVGSYMPVRATDIAYQTRLGAFTVSRAVKTLLGGGWIQAQPDPLDARVALLELTPRGRKLYRSLAALMDRRAALVVSVLSKREQAALLDMLGRLEDSAEQVLADEALVRLEGGSALSVEQKELLRWFKRSAPR